jgi:ABC-type transporter Mla subunit MlaD
MTKTTSLVACAAAFIGMGIAMPQCPGEKAMQDQVDALKATQITMTQKLNAVDAQSKTANADSAQIKQALTQLAGVIDTQRDALKRLDDAVKDLQTKVAALSAPKAKPSAKSKKKGH